ncbi:deoxynucleoside kinase [Parachitinimonas caeni]|uniref:Deoxynucleoside kinase n=1 Tax=Parachitinimonas caeni TaxID=3031301 RepID=A0ABT7DRW3_9NEIS|nr:deoxynucleoside kinase [Parachitinimonas caeni]MDK2122808.1 deoxynucleoside kinase [Parachitinimonas caeni]
MTLDRYRYLVVEGPIGAGKTALARKLADHLNANAMLERPDDVPFLPKFYVDMPRYALATQLSFLFQRVHQISDLAQIDLFHGQTVADFLFDKDPLFAELTLSDDEFKLYSDIFHHLKLQTPKPDLVIYLQADVEILLQRIRARGHEYELKIPDGYLRKLVERYSRFFYDFNDAPLLIVNANNLDFVDESEDFAILLRRIEAMKSGREYFNKS